MSGQDDEWLRLYIISMSTHAYILGRQFVHFLHVASTNRGTAIAASNGVAYAARQGTVVAVLMCNITVF